MDAIEHLTKAKDLLSVQHREDMFIVLATERSRGLATTGTCHI